MAALFWEIQVALLFKIIFLSKKSKLIVFGTKLAILVWHLNIFIFQIHKV